MSQFETNGRAGARRIGAVPDKQSVLNRGRASQKDIAQLAFIKWLKRGCPLGADQRDWLKAEAMKEKFHLLRELFILLLVVAGFVAICIAVLPVAWKEIIQIFRLK